jgi:hypothetical protein
MGGEGGALHEIRSSCSSSSGDGGSSSSGSGGGGSSSSGSGGGGSSKIATGRARTDIVLRYSRWR